MIIRSELGRGICEFDSSSRSACHTETSNRPSSVLRRSSANMPRDRWCGLPLPVLCLLGAALWIASAAADCWYDGEMHPEGEEVATAEPCLNCTCNRGTLLCYLRVCPRLPNPPPPGCILLHRHRTCCPELICTEIYGGGNSLEARSEPDGFELQLEKTHLKNACVANGSIYGPGSAMDSSTLCEYCYCLGGKQTCVKPKCLSHIEGCIPLYEPSNCCPAQYNCSDSITTTTSTTTLKPSDDNQLSSGCIVDGVFYREGDKVLGIGHSVCDNCYCLRGILRCEPLSCAPPLLGCSPVVRPGECCAASYNCSGTIEIQPKPNIGQYPTVSKEYAKLRKEVQQKPTKSPLKNKNVVTENSNIPFYVIAETSKTRTFGTTRQFTGATFDPIAQTPTTPAMNEQKVRSGDYLEGLTDETLLSIVDSLLDNRLNRRVDNNETTTESIETTTFDTVTSTTEEITTEAYTLDSSTTDLLTTTEEITATTAETNISSHPVTLKTVLNSTDCIDSNNNSIQNRQDLEIGEVTTILPVDANEINKLEIVKNIEDYMTTSSELTTENTTDDVTEVDLESRVKVSSATLRNIPKVPIEIESILNITKDKEHDYEYDYNEPSLPPSLPNLRIIPFVAADALDLKKEKDGSIYPPQERVTDTAFGYTNFFSPPVETEGGFIPKDPPILENFYENTVTAPSLVNTPKPEGSCISEGREIPHGEPVASDSPCVTCSCFYGNIVCQKVPCPIPRPGCRKSSTLDLDAPLCCPHYICDDEEAPTVVLDRLDSKSNPQEVITVAEGVNTPDPFRDVIRTEPAPNLQSLIVDMIPLLARISTTPSSVTTTEKPITTTTNKINDDLTLDKVLQLLFSNPGDEKVETTTATTTISAQTPNVNKTKSTAAVHYNITTASSINEELSMTTTTTESIKSSETRNSAKDTDSNHLNSVDSSHSGMALLKLAGCNIYGRMYRVGRIISELSNPCLECKCTEIGVQCRALKC